MASAIIPNKTNPNLQGGEQALVDALHADKICWFEHKGVNALPESKRTIRGDILGQILRGEIVDGEDGAIKLPRAVNIYGAFIQGPLDMSDTDTGLTLRFLHCKFDSEIDFNRAKLAQLNLEHSDLVGANMDFLETQSHLWFDNVHNIGPLALTYAKIEGQFSAVSNTRQTRFINPEGAAINAQGAKIAAGVFLRGAHVEGMADFNGADIGGQFAVDSLEKHTTQFINPKGKAINAQGAKIADHVILRGAHIEGTAAFNGADIGGQFSASSLKKHVTRFINPKGQAINAQGAKIAEGVFLRGAQVKGIADFNGADIGGQFSANSLEKHVTHFINPKGETIDAQGAKIAEDVVLNGARFEGTADFNSADIGGQFVTKESSFISASETALVLENAAIDGHCCLDNLAHRPIGAVNLRSARFSKIYIDTNTYPFGQLILEGTTYKNWEFLNPTASPIDEGWLRPLSAKNRKLHFTALENDVNEGLSQALRGQKLSDLPKKTQEAMLDKKKSQLRPHSDFTTPFGYWPAFAALSAAMAKDTSEDGDRYLDKTELQAQVRAVLDKTMTAQKTHERSPFAYRQFAKVLDANGHEAEARDVRVAAGDAYTERMANGFSKWRGLAYRVWRGILKCLLAYGVKPWRILPALGIYWLLGWSVFAIFDDTMTPAKERFYMAGLKKGELPTPYKLGDALPEGYPEFSASVYALDVMLPVADFAQESHWRPRNMEYGRWNWMRIVNRIYLILGWLLSTLAIAGMSGLISDKRE